jgi:hypothetical protein
MTMTLADHPALSRGDPWKAARTQAFRPSTPHAPQQQRGVVTDSFGVWMAIAKPQYRWDYRHFLAMQQLLDRVTAGVIRRAYFQVAIRHGKTEHNSVGYAAYRLERDPRTASSSDPTISARPTSCRARSGSSPAARGVLISSDRDTAGEWETEAGGGVRAVGAGAGVASVNADSSSSTIRSAQSRRGRVTGAPRSRVGLDHQRLPRALRAAHGVSCSRCRAGTPTTPRADSSTSTGSGGPCSTCLVEPRPNDPLGRAVNEPLWPEWRGEEWLDEKRAELLEYGFASLIQGRPRPREGGMFKWNWWQLLDAVPAVGRMVRYWDLAGTEAKGRGHDPDYSAGALACRMQDLAHRARRRRTLPEVDRAARRRARGICRDDLAKYRGRIAWWIETEAGIAGVDRTAALVRRLQALGMPVYTEHPTGKKVLRAEPLASRAEAGNVVLCGARGATASYARPGSTRSERGRRLPERDARRSDRRGRWCRVEARDAARRSRLHLLRLVSAVMEAPRIKPERSTPSASARRRRPSALPRHGVRSRHRDRRGSVHVRHHARPRRREADRLNGVVRMADASTRTTCRRRRGPSTSPRRPTSR